MKRFDQFQVYVGCGLTHASQEFRDQVEAFKKDLGQFCTVLDFLGIGTSATPRQVYDHDIGNCVENADLLVAICDEPSTGLGYELATQIEKRGKPCLMVARRGAVVTRLILDMGKQGAEFRRYDHFSEVLHMTIEKLTEMAAANKQLPLFSGAGGMGKDRAPTPESELAAA